MDPNLETELRALWDHESEEFLPLVHALRLDPGADFRDADLRGMDFTNQNLRGFDFSGADFRGCNLTGASFDGTRLEGAIFDPQSDPREPETGDINTILDEVASASRAPARIKALRQLLTTDAPPTTLKTAAVGRLFYDKSAQVISAVIQDFSRLFSEPELIETLCIAFVKNESESSGERLLFQLLVRANTSVIAREELAALCMLHPRPALSQCSYYGEAFPDALAAIINAGYRQVILGGDFVKSQSILEILSRSGIPDAAHIAADFLDIRDSYEDWRENYSDYTALKVECAIVIKLGGIKDAAIIRKADDLLSAVYGKQAEFPGLSSLRRLQEATLINLGLGRRYVLWMLFVGTPFHIVTFLNSHIKVSYNDAWSIARRIESLRPASPPHLSKELNVGPFIAGLLQAVPGKRARHQLQLAIDRLMNS